MSLQVSVLPPKTKLVSEYIIDISHLPCGILLLGGTSNKCLSLRTKLLSRHVSNHTASNRWNRTQCFGTKNLHPRSLSYGRLN